MTNKCKKQKKQLKPKCEIDKIGNKYWYINGKLHREDGPACEYADGNKFWKLNGKKHREDGPAIEFANGDKQWWINGKELTKEEFNKLSNKSLKYQDYEVLMEF